MSFLDDIFRTRSERNDILSFGCLALACNNQHNVSDGQSSVYIIVHNECLPLPSLLLFFSPVSVFRISLDSLLIMLDHAGYHCLCICYGNSWTANIARVWSGTCLKGKQPTHSNLKVGQDLSLGFRVQTLLEPTQFDIYYNLMIVLGSYLVYILLVCQFLLIYLFSSYVKLILLYPVSFIGCSPIQK